MNIFPRLVLCSYFFIHPLESILLFKLRNIMKIKKIYIIKKAYKNIKLN